MLAGRYFFSCRITRQALAPAFKGSMLRGAFGHSFRKISCALRRQDCAGCLLAATCPYSVVFENHAANDTDPGGTRVSSRPHPYILAPPLDETRQYRAGDLFRFGLTLFGKANDYLPHIVYAVENMGNDGIGGKNGGQRGQFALETVAASDREIYDDRSKKLDRDFALTELTLAAKQREGAVPAHSLEITFTTPLRLKHQNKLQGSLPFHLLIRTALRRVSILEQHYGNGEPDLDYRGMISRAEAVTISTDNSRWIELERYSSRQKTPMLLGGLAGSIRYAGDRKTRLDEFLPLLRYCEQTGLGKQTSFGLGQISLL